MYVCMSGATATAALPNYGVDAQLWKLNVPACPSREEQNAKTSKIFLLESKAQYQVDFTIYDSSTKFTAKQVRSSGVRHVGSWLLNAVAAVCALLLAVWN